MRFLTDKQVEAYEVLPEEADPQQVFADADRVYNYLNRTGPLSEDELRKYGERNELPPDRLNAALAVLREDGRVVAVEDRPSP